MIILVRERDDPNARHGPDRDAFATWRYTRRGWRRVPGNETFRPRPDNEPYRVLIVDEHGDELASLRLLQTPKLPRLAAFLPPAIGNFPVLRHPLTWESTRMRVDDAAPIPGPAYRRLMTGLFKLVLGVGLTRAVSLYTPGLRRILVRTGVDAGAIGSPLEHGTPASAADLIAHANTLLHGLTERTLLEEGPQSGHGTVHTPLARSLAALVEAVRRDRALAVLHESTRKLATLQRTLLLAGVGATAPFHHFPLNRRD